MAQVLAPGHAERNGIVLDLGWKVEVAKQIKARLLQRGQDFVRNFAVDRWTLLFERFG